MTDALRNIDRMIKHLASEMTPWQPGKIHVTKYEIVHDCIIGAFDKSALSKGLAKLEFQMDKMMRNSPKK